MPDDRICGLNAVAALFARRPDDVIRLFYAEDLQGRGRAAVRGDGAAAPALPHAAGRGAGARRPAPRTMAASCAVADARGRLGR